MPTRTTVPKRERTRRLLLDAGRRVLAERGEAFTATDVVLAAEVSNGTFYNYFEDRDAFLDEVVKDSLLGIADAAAGDTSGDDPAWRFAVASTRVLHAAVADPVWGRLLLRLSESPVSPLTEIDRHLRVDLADGLAAGRFAHGDDPVTLDLVGGTLMASIRRLCASEAGADLVPAVVARLLVALGLGRREAARLAARAAGQPAGQPVSG